MVLTPVVVYATGVAVGLWRVDGSPAARLIVALLWPLGLVAAVVTIGALLVSAAVLFPMVGIAALVIGGLLWRFL